MEGVEGVGEVEGDAARDPTADVPEPPVLRTAMQWNRRFSSVVSIYL